MPRKKTPTNGASLGTQTHEHETRVNAVSEGDNAVSLADAVSDLELSIEAADSIEALDAISRHIVALEKKAKGARALLSIKGEGLDAFEARIRADERKKANAEARAAAGPAASAAQKRKPGPKPAAAAPAEKRAKKAKSAKPQATLEEVRAILAGVGKKGLMIGTLRRETGKRTQDALHALRAAGELKNLGGAGAGTIVALA